MDESEHLHATRDEGQVLCIHQSAQISDHRGILFLIPFWIFGIPADNGIDFPFNERCGIIEYDLQFSDHLPESGKIHHFGDFHNTLSDVQYTRLPGKERLIFTNYGRNHGGDIEFFFRVDRFEFAIGR